MSTNYANCKFKIVLNNLTAPTPILTGRELLTSLSTTGAKSIEDYIKKVLHVDTLMLLDEKADLGTEMCKRVQALLKEDIEQIDHEKSVIFTDTDPETYGKTAISACTLVEHNFSEILNEPLPAYYHLQANSEEYKEALMHAEVDGNIDNWDERKIMQSELWPVICLDGRLLHNICARALLERQAPSFLHYIDAIASTHLPDGTIIKASDRMDQRAAMELFLKFKEVDKKINRDMAGLIVPKYKNQDAFNKLHNTYAYANLDERAHTAHNATKVGMHIDNIYFDQYGRAHIYNYKFCLTGEDTWAAIKTKKYAAEKAVIKAALASKGIEVAEIINIPILVKYDLNTKKIIGFELESNIYDKIKQETVERLMPKVKGMFTLNLHSVERVMPHYDLVLDTLKVEHFMAAVNPNVDSAVDGITLSAKAWLTEHQKDGTIKLNEDGKSIHVIFDANSDEVDIPGIYTDERNEDLLEAVKSRAQLMSTELPIIVSEMADAIRNSWALGHPNFNSRNFGRKSVYFNHVFEHYMTLSEQKDGSTIWDWEPLYDDQLRKLGIFMFENHFSHLIDVITVSPFKLNLLIPTQYKHTNILGEHTQDMAGVTSLKSCYGHLELLRSTAVVNQVISLLTKINPNIKLGQFKIVSPLFSGEALIFTATEAVGEFAKITTFLNHELKSDFKNNFTQTLFISPLEVIVKEYDAIISCLDNAEHPNAISGLDIELVKNAKTKYALVRAMQLLQNKIEDMLSADEPEEIYKFATSSTNETKRRLANIYIAASEFVNKSIGFEHPEVKYINDFERAVLPLYANPDANIRQLSNIYTLALDTLASDFQTTYGPIRNMIAKYYDAKGLTGSALRIKGNAKSLFEKMFKKDPTTGKKTWFFVNPYSDSECSEYGLDSDDRAFLKKALFHFAKIRHRHFKYLGSARTEFNFKDENDKALKSYILDSGNNYFIVPLEMAASALTFRYSVKQKLDAVKLVMTKMSSLKTAKEALSLFEKAKHEEFITGSDGQQSIYVIAAKNKINHAMISSEDIDSGNRARALNQHPEDYFETNIEYLLADYTENLLKMETYKNVEFYAKNMLFSMYMCANLEGRHSLKLLKRSMEELEKYMKLNIYEGDIMTNFQKKIMKRLDPMKSTVSAMFIAGNLRSMFRDTFEGLWLNTMRTITKYDTSLDAKHLYGAYGEVFKKVFESDRSLNVISELCLRYRLSNTDNAKISERAKFGRGGLLNLGYEAYSTLRGPDFLNRMTLFVARCMLDGVWDAYYLDDENILRYDCRKDARFDLLFAGHTTHPDYAKQKALYFSMVKKYNEDHPDREPISFNLSEHALPEPYSLEQISLFKVFANKIYGAYDKSQKAMYEHVAMGRIFGVFSTWMNGHVAAWFQRPGEYLGYTKSVDADGNPIIKKSEAGNELYLDESGAVLEKREDKFYRLNDDGTEEEVSGENVSPIVTEVPVPVQGIIYTLRDAWEVLRHDGFDKEKMKSEVLLYDCNRKNLRKLEGDLLAMFIYALLFGAILTPWYKNHLKAKEADNLATDCMVELLYKSTYNSFDGFMGPVAMFLYLLNDTEPTAATVNIKLLRDSARVLMGKEALNKFLYSNVPIMRTFKDSVKKDIYLGRWQLPNSLASSNGSSSDTSYDGNYRG